jgi:hypothetical protein
MKYGKSAVIGTVLALVMVFAACDNNTGSSASGTAPIIEDVFASTSQANCFKEAKTSVFGIGDNIWIGILVTDPDKDVVSATFTFGKVNGQSQTATLNAEPMEGTTVIYAVDGGDFEPGDQGIWGASVYVTDSSGHKSNSMSCQVTVQ